MKRQERIYYAHSKLIYGTAREKAELAFLRKKFSEDVYQVLDPNKDMGELGSMTPYLVAVSKCTEVICSEYKGFIGKGVYHEVHCALEKGIPVWCIKKFPILGGLVMKKVSGVRVYDENDWKVRYARLVI